MKVVATFPDLASAELAKSVLEAQEIPALIPDSNLAGMDWRLGTALGGVRLQVDEQHLEEASEVLSLAANGAAEQPGVSFAEDEKCPHCSSTHIGPDDQRRLKMLSLMFFPIAFVTLPLILMSRGKARCGDCGKTWRADGAMRAAEV